MKRRFFPSVADMFIYKFYNIYTSSRQERGKEPGGKRFESIQILRTLIKYRNKYLLKINISFRLILISRMRPPIKKKNRISAYVVNDLHLTLHFYLR